MDSFSIPCAILYSIKRISYGRRCGNSSPCFDLYARLIQHRAKAAAWLEIQPIPTPEASKGTK